MTSLSAGHSALSVNATVQQLRSVPAVQCDHCSLLSFYGRVPSKLSLAKRKAVSNKNGRTIWLKWNGRFRIHCQRKRTPLIQRKLWVESANSCSDRSFSQKKSLVGSDTFVLPCLQFCEYEWSSWCFRLDETFALLSPVCHPPSPIKKYKSPIPQLMSPSDLGIIPFWCATSPPVSPPTDVLPSPPPTQAPVPRRHNSSWFLW